MSSPAEKVDLRRAKGRATRELILDAAREVLRAHGFAAMSMRTVADAAGVRLSLVHYHFGGKQQLLVALLEHENEQLLARQRALYAGNEPLADKWLLACRYLREDIASGYVRVLWELWGAGLADHELAERWRAALVGWLDLLTAVAGGLDLPMPPRVAATVVAQLFLGAEAMILGGMPEDDVPNFAALEAFAPLIARLEA